MTGRAYGIPATALRFFNVYGTRQALSNPYTGVAAIFSSRLLGGRSPVIFEDGPRAVTSSTSPTLLRAVVTALEPGVADGEALNIGTGRSVTIFDVANVLSHELGVDLEPEVRNAYRAGDIRHCFADIVGARELLGYSPAVAFEDGMRELVGLAGGDVRGRSGRRGDGRARAARPHDLTDSQTSRSRISRQRAPSTSSLARAW